jgi:hypothetical protein
MSTYKVTLSSSRDYNIRLSSQTKYKVTGFAGGIQVPARFEDLINFDYTDKNDKYVIMYDAATQKYKMVNPDEVLSSATTEPISPGLPGDFTNQLDVDLDNKIDLDAGTW